jgi:hypothetical protein
MEYADLEIVERAYTAREYAEYLCRRVDAF